MFVDLKSNFTDGFENLSSHCFFLSHLYIMEIINNFSGRRTICIFSSCPNIKICVTCWNKVSMRVNAEETSTNRKALSSWNKKKYKLYYKTKIVMVNIIYFNEFIKFLINLLLVKFMTSRSMRMKEINKLNNTKLSF